MTAVIRPGRDKKRREPFGPRPLHHRPGSSPHFGDTHASAAHYRRWLPLRHPVAKVAVAARQVEPLDHPGLKVVRAGPVRELERVPAVVHNDLARLCALAEEHLHLELAEVVVHAHHLGHNKP